MENEEGRKGGKIEEKTLEVHVYIYQHLLIIIVHQLFL